MTKYREIIRLTGLGFSQRNIMASCGVAQKTVVKVQKRARELNLSWPLEESMTDTELQRLMFAKESLVSKNKRMPDYDYIHKELLRNGVSKKLLWTEYMEDCRANGDEPLMYSQFCYHIQQDEQKRRATMHINRKPGEQVEVDWAGAPATIIDPDTGEILKAYIFVGVMTYSQYAYVEAFLDMKQKSWITAHVHMYEFFGGVARILVPDNCKTAVVHNGGWKDQQINETYQEMAEHYGTAIIPARVRTPKDVPLVWKPASSITIPGMSVCQTYSWIWTLHELKGTTAKLWQNIPIQCFSFWMNGCFSNQLIQSRKISSNFFIGDARNHQPSSALSMYSKNGTISLEEKQVLWLMQSLTVLPMTAIRSTSQVLMLSMTSPCGRCMV